MVHVQRKLKTKSLKLIEADSFVKKNFPRLVNNCVRLVVRKHSTLAPS